MVTNAAWNYAGALFSVGITLVTTPVYLAALGLERYGALAILSAVIAPLGVLNAGVTQATVKYVAMFSAEGHGTAASECVAASLFLSLTVGIVGALCCALGAPYILGFGFKISSGLVADMEVSLRLMGVLWLTAQVSSNFRGVIEGLRDYRKVVTGDIGSSVLTACLCMMAVLLDAELKWFVIGQIIAGVLTTGYWWWNAKKALECLTLSWDGARGRLGQVWGYSSWQMANAGVAIVANFFDRYFIGISVSTVALGAYSVALRAQSVGRMFFYSVNQALFPAASARSIEAGASERLVVDATWHVSLLAGVALGGMTICGPAFLELWVGTDIASATATALRFLIITLTFEIPSATGSSYLNAHSLTRLSAFNNIATTAVTLGLMIPLGLRFGLDGVAVSGLVGLALTRPLLHLWMYQKYFAPFVTPGEFFRSFYGIGLCCAGVALALCPLADMIFKRMPGLLGFTTATVVCAPVLVAGVFVILRYGLGERRRLKELGNTIASRRIPILSTAVARMAGNLRLR